MSIFKSIISKIFPSNHPAQQSAGDSPSPATAAPAANAPVQAAAESVDVVAILTQKAAATSEKLNWKTSIVDLLKLLGLDSSLSARKTLAQELNYSGDTNDSAAMNIWLHKQVMQKLAANGGVVPDDLK